MIPGRSPHAVKNRWRSFSKKKAGHARKANAREDELDAVKQEPLQTDTIGDVGFSCYDLDSLVCQACTKERTELAICRTKSFRDEHETFDGIDFDVFTTDDDYFGNDSDGETYEEAPFLPTNARNVRNSFDAETNDLTGPLTLLDAPILPPIILNLIPTNALEISAPVPAPLSAQDIEECCDLNGESDGDHLEILVNTFMRDLATEKIAARMEMYRGGVPMLVYDALRCGKVPSRSLKLFCLGSDQRIKSFVLDTILCAEEIPCVNAVGGNVDGKNDAQGSVEVRNVLTVRRGMLADFCRQCANGSKNIQKANHALAFAIAAQLTASTVKTPDTKLGGNSRPFSHFYGVSDEEDRAETRFDGSDCLHLEYGPTKRHRRWHDSDCGKRCTIASGSKPKVAEALSSDDVMSHRNNVPSSTINTAATTPGRSKGSALESLYRSIKESLDVPTDLVAQYLEKGIELSFAENATFVTAFSIGEVAVASGILCTIGRDKAAVSLVCFGRSEVRISESQNMPNITLRGVGNIVSLETICKWVRSAVSASAATFVVGVDDDHAETTSSNSHGKYVVSWAVLQKAVYDAISDDEAVGVSFFSIGRHGADGCVEMMHALRHVTLNVTAFGASLRRLILRHRLHQLRPESLKRSEVVALACNTGLFAGEDEIRHTIDEMAAAGDILAIPSIFGPERYWVPRCGTAGKGVFSVA